MKAATLRTKSKQDLLTLLWEELRAQFNLRMQKGIEQLGTPSEIKKTRRNIALIKTILKEKSAD